MEDKIRKTRVFIITAARTPNCQTLLPGVTCCALQRDHAVEGVSLLRAIQRLKHYVH